MSHRRIGERGDPDSLVEVCFYLSSFDPCSMHPNCTELIMLTGAFWARRAQFVLVRSLKTWDPMGGCPHWGKNGLLGCEWLVLNDLIKDPRPQELYRLIGIPGDPESICHFLFCNWMTCRGSVHMYRSVFISLTVDQSITSMRRRDTILIINQSGLNDLVACAYLYILHFFKVFFISEIEI